MFAERYDPEWMKLIYSCEQVLKEIETKQYAGFVGCKGLWPPLSQRIGILSNARPSLIFLAMFKKSKDVRAYEY